MFVTGREALSSVENAISDVRTNETRLTQVLASSTQETERLRKNLTGHFRALALIRLDALVRNTVVGELDAAERRALEILRTHKAKLEQLLIRHGGAQNALVTSQAVHRTKTGTVESAHAPIAALQAQVEKQTESDPTWTAQRDRVASTRAIAEAADKKADQAEADQAIKRKPYESDPLFMYLVNRGFASAEYKASNFVRFFDRKVAQLVGFDTARPNYTLLNEIPARLREHANDLVKRFESEDHTLEQIERAALMAAGILELETKLTTAQGELKEASSALNKAQTALAALDQERTKLLEEGDRRAHDEALAMLTQAIASEDLQTMYREARATSTADDDRLVQQIEQSQNAIAKAETEVTKIRDEVREIARRRSELEGVREKFRSKRYDRPSGQFEFDGNNAIGDLIGGIVRGSIQGALLWSLFEHGYRKRRDWDDDDDDDKDDDDDGGERGPWGKNRSAPRFRFPSSSFPKMGGSFGGGGFKTGGGFKGGGFRTGGKF